MGYLGVQQEGTSGPSAYLLSRALVSPIWPEGVKYLIGLTPPFDRKPRNWPT